MRTFGKGTLKLRLEKHNGVNRRQTFQLELPQSALKVCKIFQPTKNTALFNENTKMQ